MSFITKAQLNRTLSVPFGTAETQLDPGSCVPLGVLELNSPQVAKLAWLTLHCTRMLLSGVPIKLNPDLASVYLAVYGSGGALIQTIPGQGLAYLGTDVPGIAQLSPAFAPEFGEPDTYSVLLVNNLADTTVEVVVTGSWRVFLAA